MKIKLAIAIALTAFSAFGQPLKSTAYTTNAQAAADAHVLSLVGAGGNLVTNGVSPSTGVLITHGTPSFTSGQALSLSDTFASYLANGFSSLTVYTNKITLFDNTFSGLTVSNGVISGNGAGLVNVPGSALSGYVVTNLPASNGSNDWAMLQTALSVPNSYIRFGGSYIVSNTLTPTNFIYVDGVQYGLSFARGLTNSLIDGGASNVMQSFVNIQFHGLEASNYNSVATIPITLQLPEVYDSGSGLSTRGSSVRNRNGLRINAGGGGIVQNCSFDGFSGCAVLTFNYQGTEAYKFNPTRFMSLSASNNFIAFYGGGMFWDGIPSYNAFYNPSSFARNSSEYLQLINCYASGNGIGIYWSGGNASIRGCYSDNNFVDLAATGGNNNTHGDISASTFNHGTYGAVFTSASGGMFIKGCTFFANTLPIMVASGSGAVFMNDVFGGTPCVLVTNDLNSLSTLTYASFVGCYNAQFGATNFVNVVSSNCWAVGEANSDPFFGGNNDQSFALGSWMLTNSTSTGLGVLSFSGHAGNGSGLTSLPSDLGTNTTQEGVRIYGSAGRTNWTDFTALADSRTNTGSGNSEVINGTGYAVNTSNLVTQVKYGIAPTGAVWSVAGSGLTPYIALPTNGPAVSSVGFSILSGTFAGNGAGITGLTASQISGLTNTINADNQFKAAVNEATTAALPPYAYNNTAGTITGLSIGGLTVDGIAVQAGDSVLVKNEPQGATNGVYVCTQVGSLLLYTLTRRNDFNASTNITAGDTMLVLSGTVNTNTTWLLSTAGAITVGTTPLSFVQINAFQFLSGTANNTSQTNMYHFFTNSATGEWGYWDTNGIFVKSNSVSGVWMVIGNTNIHGGVGPLTNFSIRCDNGLISSLNFTGDGRNITNLNWLFTNNNTFTGNNTFGNMNVASLVPTNILTLFTNQWLATDANGKVVGSNAPIILLPGFRFALPAVAIPTQGGVQYGFPNGGTLNNTITYVSDMYVTTQNSRTVTNLWFTYTAFTGVPATTNIVVTWYTNKTPMFSLTLAGPIALTVSAGSSNLTSGFFLPPWTTMQIGITNSGPGSIATGNPSGGFDVY